MSLPKNEIVDGVESKCLCGAVIRYGLCGGDDGDPDFGVEHSAPLCFEFKTYNPIQFVLWLTEVASQRLLLASVSELKRARAAIGWRQS